MKIRNGFVSNSSSSSFIVSYDKTKVLTDPRDIIDYVDNNLRAEILMHGTECCEGDDWFYMDMQQKNYLLKRKGRFCKFNKGTHPVTEFIYNEDKDEYESKEAGEAPYIEAYTDVYTFHGYDDEHELNIDMSDWEAPFEYTAREYLERKDDPEFRKALERNNKYYEEKSRREAKARKEEREKYINEVTREAINSGADPDNLVVKIVQVDYNSCDPDGNCDSEFAPRYFGLSEKTYYETLDDEDEE